MAGNSHFRLTPCLRSGLPEELIGDLSESLRQSCALTASLYAKTGFHPPWLGYLAIARDAYVGGCGYVGPPVDGEVEIAYLTLPEFEGRGFATLATARLVEIATTANVNVCAKTLPEENASTSVLLKLGFKHVGETTDDEVGRAWRWVLAPGSENGRDGGRGWD